MFKKIAIIAILSIASLLLIKKFGKKKEKKHEGVDTSSSSSSGQEKDIKIDITKKGNTDSDTVSMDGKKIINVYP